MASNVTDIFASMNNQSSTSSSVTSTSSEGFFDRAIALSIIFGVFVILTISGNIFVIAALILEPKLRKKQNILIGSLAITDLLVGVLVMPVGVVKEIYSEIWILGRDMCYVWLAFHVTCTSASILHLVAIAIDRYWAVSNLKYMLDRSLKRIVTMIVTSWSFGWILAIISIIGLQQLAPNQCYINMDRYSAVSSIILIYFVPVFIMITMYIKIYKVVKTTVQKTNRRKVKNSEGNSDLEDREEKREDREKNQERKTTITVCIVTGTFISCWLPFFVLALVDNLSSVGFISTALARGLVLWGGYCNSMLNPIIYTIFIEEFRHAFRRILCRNNVTTTVPVTNSGTL